jgi:hypothetical protein
MDLLGPRVTPLGAVARGLLAGAAGTAAMTAWQELAAKLQSSGDDGASGGEGSAAAAKDPWEEASAPAVVAKRVGEGVFHEDVPAEKIEFLTNAMHWSYGTTWGSAYGLVAGTTGRSTLRGGLAFGTGVWLASYAQLVPMGLYEPPWKYPPKELALDLSYHLVYGAATAAAFRLLAPH